MSDLAPCPFCGSRNVDPTGWASTEREGPACDNCGSSADTVAEWNTRPIEADLRRALAFVKAERDYWHGLVPLSDRIKFPFNREQSVSKEG